MTGGVDLLRLHALRIRHLKDLDDVSGTAMCRYVKVLSDNIAANEMSCNEQ